MALKKATLILERFGIERGGVVHSSIQIQKPIDIQTTITTIRNIERGLMDFENLLEKLFEF